MVLKRRKNNQAMGLTKFSKRQEALAILHRRTNGRDRGILPRVANNRHTPNLLVHHSVLKMWRKISRAEI